MHGNSGMMSQDVIQGRPYGWCAIMWKKSLKCKVSPVPFESTRVCSITMDLDRCKLLIVNVYMPCDNTGAENCKEYEAILGEISFKLQELNIDQVIIGGDFITDFSRPRSVNTTLLESLIMSENLRCLLSHESSDGRYTFESKGTGIKSTIDHFSVTDNLYDDVSVYSSRNKGDNLSDHHPVTMQLTTPIEHSECSIEHSQPKPLWHLASSEHIENYKTSLESNLNYVEIPMDAITCNNRFCHEHDSAMKLFHDEIIYSCLNAGYDNIPYSNMHKVIVIPGWSDYVESHKKDALFWHFLWRCNRSPRSGILADIRNKTRSKYHYALRFVKNNQESIEANKLANGLSDNKPKDFWNAVKKDQKHS